MRRAHTLAILQDASIPYHWRLLDNVDTSHGMLLSCRSRKIPDTIRPWPKPRGQFFMSQVIKKVLIANRGEIARGSACLRRGEYPFSCGLH